MTQCSVENLTVPAIGTAPSARFWVALEQPGSWGAKAFIQSRLDPGVGAALEKHCADAGGRCLLVRDPADHAEGEGERRVFVGGGPASAPWVATAVVQSADDLLRWLEQTPDLDVRPAPPAWLTACEPVLLVCTNGKRDQCCAQFGGRLARELAADFPGRVWESTHLGGHRFAVTALRLPSRQVVARMDVDLGRAALQPGLLALDEQHDRGRSDLPDAFRAADAWLRSTTGRTTPDAWRFSLDGDVVVAHGNDGEQRLLVRQSSDEHNLLPDSCGKSPVPVTSWTVTLG